MGARLLVIAVFVLAAAAAGDALRSPRAPEEPRAAALPRQEGLPALVTGGRHDYVIEGGVLLKNRVTRAGAEHLSTAAIAKAFPGKSDDPIDVSKLAVAPDGTVVIGVYRFRPGLSAEGAVELWRGSRLEGAFLVPPGYFGGGFAFSRDSALIATIASDGTLNGVFDRRGRLVSRLGGSLSR